MKCPGSMAIPACRLATWSKGHFVDKKAGSLQNGPRWPHPGNGKDDILTWKYVSRHSGMQLLISYPIRCLRTRRFCEPTFRPSGDTKHWKKHSVSQLLLPSLIFLLMTSSLLKPSLLWLFPPLLFHLVHLSTLSDVWLLNFLRWSIIVYYV